MNKDTVEFRSGGIYLRDSAVVIAAVDVSVYFGNACRSGWRHIRLERILTGGPTSQDGLSNGNSLCIRKGRGIWTCAVIVDQTYAVYCATRFTAVSNGNVNRNILLRLTDLCVTYLQRIHDKRSGKLSQPLIGCCCSRVIKCYSRNKVSSGKHRIQIGNARVRSGSNINPESERSGYPGGKGVANV